jgi:hypothetical protein
MRQLRRPFCRSFALFDFYSSLSRSIHVDSGGMYHMRCRLLADALA